MNRIVLLIFCIAGLVSPGLAQGEGIHFEKPEWKKVVRKALKENKLIFVDCYTVWCGPCKTLSKEVFPLKEVGDFYNQHFVSVKLDIQKDEAGKMLAEKYKPEGVPTLLFIDPKTEDLVHRVCGGGKADRIIEIGRQAIDPAMSLRALEKRYGQGDREVAFMEQYLKVLARTGSSQQYKAVQDAWFDGLTDEELCNPAVWNVFKANVNDPLAPVFKRYMALEGKLYSSVPKEEADKVFRQVLAAMAQSVTGFSMHQPSPEEVAGFKEYLKSIYFEDVPAMLMMLDINECRKNKDYMGMWNLVKQAYGYNVFSRNTSYLDYSCIFTLLDIHKQIQDPAVWQDVLALADQLLKKGHLMSDYKTKLLMVKANMLEALGDQVAADVVKAERKTFEESLRD